MLLGAKLSAAKLAGAATRAAGRGGGTSLPGRMLLRMQPDAIAQLAGRLPGGSIVISATNGKTTTAAMASAVLERTGTRLVHNRAGANMAGGVASALLDAAHVGGQMDGDTGLFEVDEFWLPRVADALHPRALLLGNLFRDQLDRYGELDAIADRWAAVVAAQPAGTKLVLNADDPLVADLGTTSEPVYFGIDDDRLALPALQHAADSKHCRRCGHGYVYDAAYLGHLGRYHCPNCGAHRPEPQVVARDVELHGVRSARFALHTPVGQAEVDLPLPGLYNVYNALGAAALGFALDVPLDDVVAGLEAVAPAFGRAEVVQAGGRDLVLLLVKNPAGANEVLRTLVLENGQLDLLGLLNDRTADGHDVSWVWDADFELLAPRLRTMTCGGTRAAELAVRMKYAGADAETLRVEHELERALDAALAGGDPARPLYALPTYTALLELRELLVRRGLTSRYWK
ncbi:MAG TPA: MurT ligase domain-containing protein [Solirubrobacteraceae bacterium]|jgi:UDP-N-acetylmuramyl tripeptide synthase|nr:MurT ligase domain-containing protein [Solirubrobacteraceae bacterium]